MKTRRSISIRPSRPWPQRTCVACRQVKTKRELVRVVRTADGNIEIDVSGKKAGRGAYLCPTRECCETALKSGRLERSLRTALDQQQREQLMKMAEELLFSTST